MVESKAWPQQCVCGICNMCHTCHTCNTYPANFSPTKRWTSCGLAFPPV